jgi:hypothetical protein
MKNTAPTVLRIVRRTKAQWVFNTEVLGEVETREIDLLYFSPTTKDLKEAQADAEQKYKENPHTVIWASDNLLKRLHSIPDLKVGVGQENELTGDWLDEQAMENLRSLREAIEADQTPKAQPPK